MSSLVRRGTFVQKIRLAEREFVNYIPQSDDISLLAIKYKGSMTLRHYHRGISLVNDVKEIPALAIFVGSICEDMQFDELTASGVRLAVEEAVVNVMNYTRVLPSIPQPRKWTSTVW